MGAIAVAAIGAAALAGSGFLGASAAKKRKKALKKLSQTPGLDFGDISSEYMDDVNTMMPRATETGRQLTNYQQALMDEMLDKAIPGYKNLIGGRSQMLMDAIKGKLSKDTLGQIDRGSAGRNLDRYGGFGGTYEDRSRASAIGANSLALSQWGVSQLPSVIASTPRAAPFDITQFFGPDPTQRAQFRANERSQRMGIQGQAIALPTGTDIASSMLNQVGGIMLGAGAGGIAGGGAGGGTPQMTNLSTTSIGRNPYSSYTPPASSTYGLGPDHNWWGDYTKGF